MADWDNTTAVAETPEIKLFGKWSTDDVQINDISLQVSIKTRVIFIFLFFSCVRQESLLDINLLAWCAIDLAEKMSLFIH